MGRQGIIEKEDKIKTYAEKDVKTSVVCTLRTSDKTLRHHLFLFISENLRQKVAARIALM